MTNCGISRWDDPNEINARLKALTSQPIWEVTDEYYNNVILKYFDEQCKGSKAVYEESKEYIPGGVQHNLAFNKPFPMCMAKANGAYLYDKDGNPLYRLLTGGRPDDPRQQLSGHPGKGHRAAERVRPGDRTAHESER